MERDAVDIVGTKHCSNSRKVETSVWEMNSL